MQTSCCFTQISSISYADFSLSGCLAQTFHYPTQSLPCLTQIFLSYADFLPVLNSFPVIRRLSPVLHIDLSFLYILRRLPPVLHRLSPVSLKFPPISDFRLHRKTSLPFCPITLYKSIIKYEANISSGAKRQTGYQSPRSTLKTTCIHSKMSFS